jgi:hypothetical protein
MVLLVIIIPGTRLSQLPPRVLFFLSRLDNMAKVVYEDFFHASVFLSLFPFLHRLPLCKINKNIANKKHSYSGQSS